MTTFDPQRLAAFENAHLSSGHHECTDGQGCVMDWRSYLLNRERVTDDPGDTDPVIRSYLISLNDNWPDALSKIAERAS